MQILESTYVMGIPTDPDELAVLLDNYARNWEEVLLFLTNLASKNGILLDEQSIISKVKELQGVDE